MRRAISTYDLRAMKKWITATLLIATAVVAQQIALSLTPKLEGVIRAHADSPAERSPAISSGRKIE